MTQGHTSIDPNRFLENLYNLDLSSCDVSICLASYQKDHNIPEFQQLRISKELTQEFLNIVAYNREEWKNNPDLELRRYQLDSTSNDNEFEYCSLNESPYNLIGEQIAQLRQPVVGMLYFQQDPAFLQSARYYVIRLQPRTQDHIEPICFFRQYILLRRLNKGKAAVLVGNNYYEKAAPENLFLFDTAVDAVSHGNMLLFIDKPRANQIFQFYEALIQTVPSSMQALGTRIPIDNLDAFAEACKRDKRKAVILLSIAQKSYLARLTINQLAAFNDERKLGIRIEQNKLVFEMKTLWRVLHLLNDDFLESQLTGEFYEVTGKLVLKP